VSQSTLDYLKKRYLELENEIATASHHDHDLIVADLQYRKFRSGYLCPKVYDGDGEAAYSQIEIGAQPLVNVALERFADPRQT
jgi:hypothetical protein